MKIPPMKIPQEAIRLVLHVPASEKTKQLIREIQLSILMGHFGKLPTKSILKIELINLVFAAMPKKQTKTKPCPKRKSASK